MKYSYQLDTSFFCVFRKSIFRDEKSGNEIFEVESRQAPLLDEFAKSTRKIRNKSTGELDTWYTFTCKSDGYAIPGYSPGMPLLIDGEFGQNGSYGYALFVNYIHEASDEKEICARFLTKPLKKEEAERFVEKAFVDAGTKTRHEKAKNGIFACFADESAVALMTEVDIEERVAKAVCKKIQGLIEERRLYDMMRAQKADMPKTIIPKLVKTYGNKAVKRLRNDPYRIGRFMGMSFNAQEEFAMANDGKWRADSQERARAIVYEAMRRISGGGSAFMEKQAFVRLCHAMTEVPVDGAALLDAITNGDIVGEEDGKLFNRALRDAEERIFKNLLRITATKSSPIEIPGEVVSRAEDFCKVTYGPQQREAFRKLLASPGIKILTGGPGTGKTTTCKGLIHAYKELYGENKRVKLCAPTGRAAQRMSESTGLAATTVHRLLEYCPYGEDATHKNAADPIAADLIVVDEISMMDIALFDIFLEAVPTGATILLVGDQNQLEPVGAGHILQDLLDVREDYISRQMLTDVYRQQGESAIIENSIRIKQDNADLAYKQDFQLIRTRSEEDTLQAVLSLQQKLYKKSDPFETQVLCPSRKGAAGLEVQNKEFQKLLNADGRYVAYGDDRFRISDKVLMIRNNYEKDYYNGDVGVIKRIDGSTLFIEIRGKLFEITRDLLGDVKLAYSMTVHKSQGSEFKNVIVVLPEKPGNMLVKNLFYTAVTRAKEQIYIVSQGASVEKAIVTKPKERKTFLSGILKDAGWEKARD